MIETARTEMSASKPSLDLALSDTWSNLSSTLF